METLLAILLLASIAGLLGMAYYATQLKIASARLDAELSAQRGRYDQDHKQWMDSTAALKGQYNALVGKYNENAQKWNESATALKSEIHRLSRWKNVADAETAAAEMRHAGEVALEKARAEADNVTSTAHHRATELVAEAEKHATALTTAANESATAVTAEAKKKAKSLTSDLQAILDSVTTQVAQIVDAANKKAEEIGGSAYQAMKNAAVYEHAAKAMRNIIDGYGDRFVIPPQNLFDGLADDFSHVQAGRELKRSREYVKAMVRNGAAAACDYVEANRRETAVNFVVDAFNGKVDSILSRIKHDNAGKLSQQIRDAFALVNYNGKAFRDARITAEYLDARLDELKWSAAVQHLVMQDREEQRDAKERAREEARAAKEIERAMRDAAKEESILQTALEQAKEQFEQATGEQKSLYEARLQEMEQRLKEAMERKDRARSMAEQTKKGHVYVISNVGSFGEDMFKIGLTRRWDPHDRVSELGGASVPFGFDVHAMIVSDDAPALEQRLHEAFTLKQVNKVNHRKEFFKVSLKEIREQIEAVGLNGVSWTMTAIAREYRETLVTEQKIADSAAERERWMSRQRRLKLEADDTDELVSALADDE
jgi:hypothetical protein